MVRTCFNNREQIIQIMIGAASLFLGAARDTAKTIRELSMAQLCQQLERRKVLSLRISAILDFLIVWTITVATKIIVTTDHEADFDGVETINPIRATS